MKKYTLLMLSVFALVGCDQKSTQPADKAAAKPADKAAAKPADKAAAKPADKAAAKPADKAAAKPADKAAAKPADKAAAKLAAPSAVTGLPAPADVKAAPADAEKTASGLASKVLKKGTGTKKPVATDTVKVHYTGWTTDGKMFDSSVMRGQPASFALNQVIPGWTEGVALMVEGEKRRFWIPGKLAYGDTPKRPGAPAGPVVVDVDLIEIEKPQSPEEAKALFEAFLKAMIAGSEKICACKDMQCAQGVMMSMQRSAKPPKGRPTEAQLAQMMPHMQKLDGCWKKLQAAAMPKPPAVPAAGKSAPAPAKK